MCIHSQTGMRNMFQPVIFFSVAVVASGITAPTMKAEAAKASKITMGLYVAAEGITKSGKKDDWLWVASYDQKAAGCKKITKTVNIKPGKKVHVTFTAKRNKTYQKKITGVHVLCVDALHILEKFSKVKYSNVVVKCDGKKVSAKYCQGNFEPNGKKHSHRLSIYNAVGKFGDNSKSLNKNTKFKFKKNISISFDIVAK